MNFEINGHAYSSGRLDAVTQFQLARRLSPLLKGLGGVVESLGGIFNAVTAAREGRLIDTILGATDPFRAVQPFAEALGEMSDDNVNYIIRSCLGVVQRSVAGGNGWGAIQTPSGTLMYSDMDWLEMIQIVQKVLEDNLASFTRAAT